MNERILKLRFWPRNQDIVDETFQRRFIFTMEEVLSICAAHNHLHTTYTSMKQRKLMKKISLEVVILGTLLLREVVCDFTS